MKKVIIILKKDKFTSKEGYQFMEALSGLLNSGFSLWQAIHFMSTILPDLEGKIAKIEQRLSAGQTLNESLKGCGYSQRMLAQLDLAQEHGQLDFGVEQICTLLHYQLQIRNKVVQLVLYPCFLLILLGSLAIAMQKMFVQQGLSLLPSRKGCLWMIVSMFMLIVLLILFKKRITGIKRAKFLSCFPFLGELFRNYYTALLSAEWSVLLKSGLDSKEIVETMCLNSQDGFICALGNQLKDEFSRGLALAEGLKKVTLLRPTFSLLFQKGSDQPTLSRELQIYASWQQKAFEKSVERLLAWLQPLLFLIIAIMILNVYMKLLMPIYQTMEGIGV